MSRLNLRANLALVILMTMILVGCLGSTLIEPDFSPNLSSIMGALCSGDLIIVGVLLLLPKRVFLNSRCGCFEHTADAGDVNHGFAT